MNRPFTCRTALPLAFLVAVSLGIPVVSKAAVSTAVVSTPAQHKRHRKHRRAPVAANSQSQAAVIHTSSAIALRTSVRRRHGRYVRYSPWTEPTFADSTIGDNVDGEDLVVRKAAVDALGSYNGSIVVADPETGRILSMVNQKLATKGAFQPCSTVKMVVSLASLSEGIVDSNTRLHVTRRFSMDMTDALAHSNNLFFAKLGEELGFDRVEKYARLYGLGEKAGLDIPGEEAGYLTSAPPQSGVGMMTSFGDGIRVTPLELTSIVSTIANGGTMYYLQYPRSEDEVQKFIPRIKRELDIANVIPEIKPGMMGAVEYGTARRANFNMSDPVFGKTGTCTDMAQPGVHLGWFGSFNDVGNKKLVVVVLMTGGRGTSGPIASGIAGSVYHNLATQNYFGPSEQPTVPTTLVSLQN